MKASLIGKVSNDSLKWGRGLVYSVNLSLINNTDSVINFWMNNCSWDDSFISNFESLQILRENPCDRNFPIVITLNKDQHLDFNGFILVPDSFYQNHDLRVGFVYIKKNERSRVREIVPPPPDEYENWKHQKQENVIWSNYFKLVK